MQIGHAYVLLRAFFNDGHAPAFLIVRGASCGFGAKKLIVNPEDDFHVPRQHALHQRDRPSLQGFRQQRVVGVAERAQGKLPGFVPIQHVLINQKTHELGNARLGCVSFIWMATLPGRSSKFQNCAEKAHNVAERACDKKIFLGQAQLFAGEHGVRWIENAGDIFRSNLLSGDIPVMVLRKFVQYS